MKNKVLILSIIFPIICLITLIFYKQSIVSQGLVFELNIKGFDPIDVLSGHYVTYTVDYPENPCLDEQEYACVCLKLNESNPSNLGIDCEKKSYCDAILKGECKNKIFRAGIERYYIPENRAKEIDEIVRAGKSKIKISVSQSGEAIVTDLLLVK